MIFKKLEIENFRNIEKQTVIPGEKVNIICGENAQGKTNLIEAMWLFTGARSFRQSKDSELIKMGKERAKLKAEFFSEERLQNAEITFSPSKSIKKNGIDIKSSAEYAGTCGGVVFSPAQMNLFRDGPKERRKLIDTSLCQIYPRYISILSDYKKVMEERNALLKDTKMHSSMLEMLDVYDRQLSSLGGSIMKTRINYCDILEQKAKLIYEGISKGRENLSLSYVTDIIPSGEKLDKSVTSKEWAEKLAESLYRNRNYDIEHGVTNTGPHRDDMEVMLDNLPVKSYGSQGQQRSCILSVKLGEAKILGDIMKEPPLILLDDVMSELDGIRRDYILNSIGESQIFVTCCDRELFSTLGEGKVFIMEKGKLVEG